jgi:hypothetical protein
MLMLKRLGHINSTAEQEQQLGQLCSSQQEQPQAQGEAATAALL